MRIKLMLFLFIASNVAVIYGESFIAKPKKKSPSNNVLKESCGQTCGSILKKIPHTQRSMANMQERVMEMVSELVEGEKNGFFAKASKAELQACYEELEQLEHELEQLTSHMIQRTNRIAALEKQAIGRQ